jgi:hypothetical protein
MLKSIREMISLFSDEERIYLAMMASLLILLVTIGIGFRFFSAYNEAQAFNRLSNGPQVTVWDAVWLDLRVEACK